MLRFQNWGLKSSLSKFPSIHCLNISEDLDLTDLKKDIGKQYKETGDTTYITIALLFTHHCSAGTAIHSPHLIPISPEPAPWSWHVHPHETSLRQENVNCPLGIKMQTHTAIWKCCGKRSTGLCPMPLFKIFFTELFITSLYLGI